jgi:hypothetical protein
MHGRTFTFYNVVGGTAWVVLLTTLGWALGTRFPGIADSLDLAVLVIVALSLVPIAIEYLRHRRSWPELLGPPTSSPACIDRNGALQADEMEVSVGPVRSAARFPRVADGSRGFEQPGPARRRPVAEPDALGVPEPDQCDVLEGLALADADRPEEEMQPTCGMARDDVAGTGDLLDVTNSAVDARWRVDRRDGGRNHHESQDANRECAKDARRRDPTRRA